jgi:hypothetical protein
MKNENKRKLKTFIGNEFIGTDNLKFGDYILFQEYTQDRHDGTQYHYKISKPILAIYLGYFVADQTLGFDFIRWNNEDRNTKTQVIEQHIEWSDYIDVLGHWKTKPSWKEIIVAFRQKNPQQDISSDEINWE